MANTTQRRALVSGGSSGIGLAVAKKLAENGISVTIADIVPPVESVPNCKFQYCNVCSGRDVDALFKKMLTQLPDILVLSAGKGIHERLTEGDPEKWGTVLDLNIMGVLRCVRAFVPPMQQNKKGNVVFISSVSAKRAYSYGGIYAASKAAIEIIADTLRIETAPDIAVTTIIAGVTDTDFFKDREDRESLFKNIGSLNANDIAEDVFYAINQPPGKSINAVITRPFGQEF